MFDHNITRHAEVRMGQRGFRQEDIEEVLLHGTRVAPDAYLMQRTDANREIAALKCRIRRMERLKDLKVVVEGDRVITCYRSAPANQQRTLRRGRASR